MATMCFSAATSTVRFIIQPPPSSSSSLSSSSSSSYSLRSCLSFSNHTKHFQQLHLCSSKKMIQSSCRKSHVVCMAPEEEKMTRRSPLDFPIEWERPKPGRRPDIFPQFSPMKTPLPTPMPADPPEEDEDEEEKKEEEEEDPEKEEQENPDKQ